MSCPYQPHLLPDEYDVSIVTSTYNRAQVFRKVIESFCDQTMAPERFELVVADDASTDETHAMIKEMQAKVPFHIEYIRHAHNSGQATGRNNCIRAARGKVVLFVDDDVLADRHLLEEHYKMHQRFETCVCNGWVNHVTEPERPKNPKFTMDDISTSFLWTSNASVKRKHLFEAGLFDEDFREYGWEDPELGLRLMALGLRNHNNRKAIGYHVKRVPKLRDVERMCRQAEAKGRNAVLYVSKHDRVRSRLATGLTAPHLAFHKFTKLCNWMERLCLRRLSRPGLTPESELAGFDAWCANQLYTLHYYNEIERCGN